MSSVEEPDSVPPQSAPPPRAIAAAHPSMINHPDRATAWVVAMVARARPKGRLVEPSQLASRLADLSSVLPMVAGRLHGDRWDRGEPSDVVVSPAAEPLDVVPLQPFDLLREAPLRVTCPPDGSWLMLCAHHAAFDGLAMVSILRSLVTGIPEAPTTYHADSVSSRPEVPWPLLRRVLRPADRVAISAARPPSETLVARTVTLSGKHVTGRLAAACVRGVAIHNRRLGAPLRRLGISIAVGGVGSDSATYRRIDMAPDGPVERLVEEALSTATVPREMVGLPRAARLVGPFVYRLSDTFLVSNLGRRGIDAVDRVDFFPVARGRSAVAFGAIGVAEGLTSLTLRARDLDRTDADKLLDDVVAVLGSVPTRT